MRVGELCNREVVIAEAGDTIIEAAQLMRHHHVGDVVVVRRGDQGNEPVAVLTDRDLVVEVLAQSPDRLLSLTIGDVATDSVITVDEDRPASFVVQLMREQGIRRVPVVSADKTLVGILAYDDLVEYYAHQLAELAGVVSQQARRERETRP